MLQFSCSSGAWLFDCVFSFLSRTRERLLRPANATLSQQLILNQKINWSLFTNSIFDHFLFIAKCMFIADGCSLDSADGKQQFFWLQFAI
jgi:hypothetical protein